VRDVEVAEPLHRRRRVHDEGCGGDGEDAHPKFILTPACAAAKLISFVSRRGKGGQVKFMFPLNATWSLGTRVDICA
jgi:hypothetical protein